MERKRILINILEILVATILVTFIILNINRVSNSCESSEDIVWYDLPDYCESRYKLNK